VTQINHRVQTATKEIRRAHWRALRNSQNPYQIDIRSGSSITLQQTASPGQAGPHELLQGRLQPLEWRALYCRVHSTTTLPAEPPSLAQVVLWVARLGGYLARKHDRPPGPTVIWRGFLALHEVTAMYRIFRQNE
jgi:hypothetical protein